MADVKKIATRESYGNALAELGDKYENLYVLDADLAAATKTGIFKKKFPDRHFDCGIAEANMMGVAAGLAATGKIPFASTFAMFAAGRAFEQVRNSIGYPHLNVKIGATHAGISVGEDGATHEPIEHLAGLRAIPDLNVIRPADGKETTAAWLTALTSGLPTCLVLTRQGLPQYDRCGCKAFKGGYVLSDCEGTPDVLLMASGSEVEQCMQAKDVLAKEGIAARVISMPCMEIFNRQDAEYKEQVMPASVRARVAVEAGATMPWYRYVGLDGEVIGIDHFGASAPAAILFKEYGFTVENVVATAKRVLGK